MVIALCGYMGCGKSTLGKILANKLGIDFCDTDEYIEKKQNQSIPQIFEKSGESFFRQLESEALCELIKKDNILLSLGGGLPIAEQNKEILKKAYVIYLDVPFEECYSRIAQSDRPIVKSKSKDGLREHFENRTSHYRQVANLVVKYDTLDNMINEMQKIAREVLQ